MSDIKLQQFSNMTDEKLAEMAKLDDDALNYLIKKYKPLVTLKSRAYFLVGGDKEDIIQEGMIGLFKAIKDFNPDFQVYFYSFADLCISRQIISAVKAANRQKHIPLNEAVSFNKKIRSKDGSNETTILDTLSLPYSNHENLVINREDKKYIEEKIGSSLSTFEWKVLVFYLQDYSYHEIAKKCEVDTKSIDNALQRIRRKIAKIISFNKNN